MSAGPRERFGRRLLAVVLVLSANVVVVQQQVTPTSAATFPTGVVEPPLAPTSIVVFPERDFVSVEGLDDAARVGIQVWRGGNLIGRADGMTPAGGIVEVNHPGGACWASVTPDIRAGDKVIVVESDAVTGAQLSAEATTTADVRITAAAAAAGPDIVVVRGTARTAAGEPIPLDQLEVRLIGSSADPFDANGRRSLRASGVGDDGTVQYDGAGTSWTATFPGLSSFDVTRAVAATSEVLWLGADPAAGVEATNFESPGAPGPWSPTCNAPLQGPAVGASPTSLEFPATQVGDTSAVRSIIVTNTGHDLEGGSADLLLQTIEVTSTEFQIVPTADACVVGAPVQLGATCRVSVSFSPTAASLASGALRLRSNASGPATDVPLSGLGRVADVGSLRALPAAVAFGSAVPGVPTRTQSIRIRNDGNVAVVVGGITVDAAGVSAGFGVLPGSDCLANELAPGGECTIASVLVPTGSGPLGGSITITSDIAPDVVVSLSGTGLANGGPEPLAGSGVELGVFSARDFVSVGGFVPGDGLTMQIVRNGVVVGVSRDVPVGPDGVAEVNHPGGACWEDVTPDIRPFDVLRVTLPDGRYYETVTADVGLDGHATYVQEPNGTYTVEVHGWARYPDGSPIPLSQLESRLVASSADPFDLSGRRTLRTPDDGVLSRDTADNPDGSRVTARWTGLTLHDALLAADLGTDSRLMWLGFDPIALNQITFFEHGADVANGPWDPSCGPAEPTSPGFAAAPSVVDFASASVDGPGGSLTTRRVTVNNTGTAPLRIDRFDITGDSSGEFAVVGAVPPPISPGGRAVVELVFDPEHVGAANATLVVTDDALGAPHRIELTGIGAEEPVATIAVDPSSLTFDDTAVGSQQQRSITIANEGDAGLDLTSIEIVGDDADAFGFDIGSTCTVALAVPGPGSCVLVVEFAPSHVNTSTATVRIVSSASATPVVEVPLVGTSSTAPGGVFDPPRAPVAVEVFPVRDYVIGTGFTEDTFVNVEVIRNGDVVATESHLVPLDDPDTDGFDGIVEINHGAPLVAGGPVVCWTGTTPDLATGDTVRMTVENGAGAVIASHQTHTQGVEVSMPATQVAPGTVQVAGYATDVFAGGPIGDLEVRIVSTSAAQFDANGRRSLRTGGEGSITWVTRDAAGVGSLSPTPAGREWIATFSGLSAADVARATAGQAVVLWLGRDPLAGVELTHAEYGEIVGPAGPDCTAPAERPEPSVSTSALSVGFAGVGAPTTGRTVTLTNPGPGSITVAPIDVTSLSGPDAVDFDVTGTSCPASLAAAASCTVSIRLDPVGSELGGRFASLAIRHSGANGVTFVPLSGEVVAPPTIASVSPAPPARVAPGQVVRVVGTNLLSTSSVTVANRQATVTVISDTELDVRLAANTPQSSTAATMVLTAAGGVVTRTSAVRVQQLVPTFTSFSSTAPLPGQTITITGTNLTNVVSVVFAGGASGVFTSNSATSLSVVVPAGASAGPLVITTAGGSVTTPSLGVVVVPTITGFGSTSIRTGATLTITGTNLRGATTTTVTFTGAAAVNATVNAAGTSLTVVVPNAARQGTVTVTVGTRSALSPTELVVERAPAAVSFSATPVVRGATVTVNGQNFLATRRVTLGKVAASFTIVSSTRITLTVPAGAVTAALSVENQWGRATSAAPLNVLLPPTITSLSTTTVSNDTGTSTVVINGSNLAPGTANLTVTFGATPVVVVTSTAARLTVRVPTNVPEGLHTVRVTTPAGTAVAAVGIRVT